MTKKKMIEFINGFEKYPTMNSWNNSYGYSYNVKIHSLPVKRDIRDALYDMLGSDDFYDHFNWIIEDWESEMKKFGTHTEKREARINIAGLSEKEIAEKRKFYEEKGWTYDRHGTEIMTIWRWVDEPVFGAGFNGRSGGHLVLYKWNGHNYGGSGWVHDEDELNEMTAYEVKEIYEVLREFEKLYKSLVKECEYMAENFKVEEEEYSVKKTRSVLVEK